MKFAYAATLAAAFLLAPAAQAATTVEVAQGSGQRSLTLPFAGPVGQTFTAAGTDLLSFGFQVQTLNPGSANAPITLTLYDGIGTAGSVLGSFTATFAGIPASRTPTWIDFDLTGTTLTAGGVYSALLTSDSYRYGVIYGPDINFGTGQPVPGGIDAYAGGQIIARDGLSGICAGGATICDANFRFTYDTVAGAVPEPATWAMMIGGIGAVGGAMRRRQRTAVRFA